MLPNEPILKVQCIDQLCVGYCRRTRGTNGGIGENADGGTFQRVAFQKWVDPIEGMPEPGTVVRVLGGDLLKEAGLVPQGAMEPEERSPIVAT